ncbi:carboxymuconolactone decarboxylase family protein [Corynebacterium freiburgense]|uniref:carboxymuconolactone decarboxylase family protein n=1 Tax=Corynebacterium freiburgense TaxID=556548 RepID=UPI0004233B31|nr:carboxymuconolactone decarboxylase family protein [Corynebacterium freiburgense]WJZ02940.1 Carboxymuconolactone decarboxylase family protein [Corynebacterium freiburgense]
MEQHKLSRYEFGKRVLSEVEKNPEGSILDDVAVFCPDLERFVIEFGYADVFARPGLLKTERQLATIAALAAMGNAPKQLRFHINGALNVGCTPQQVIETFVHETIYAGFPAALNAVSVAREVFSARGIAPDVSQHQTEATRRFDTGSKLLKEIDGAGGTAVVEALADIAPDLGRFIVEYSFGDVYARPGLTLKERELVTVAACIALGTCVPQLRLHMQGYLNVGGTTEELIEIIIQMAVYAGFPAALNGLSHLRSVLTD